MIKKIFFCAFLLFGQNFLLFSQVNITFKVVLSQALKDTSEHLYLAGTFNNWNPADTSWQLQPDGAGAYHLNKAVPRGISTFKVTRGSWNTVECLPGGKSADNRTLNILNDTLVTLSIPAWQDYFPSAAKKHTATAQVHIVSEKFNMPQLGRQRRVWIYLPAGYRTSKKRYPVIYMHDGQNLFDDYTSGYGEWGIDEIMDKLSPRQQSIIVGIDHGGDFRITEYDPYDSRYGKGRGDDYVQFLVKNLKPYIDANYRTRADASHTTIAGSSMGGLISMYAALKYPQVFGNAGIFSPAFWIAPGIYDLAKQKNAANKAKFYFVCGDAESDTMVADMEKMANIVRSKGTSPKNSPIVIKKGASHNEKQWNSDFPDFYKWLIKP